MVGPARQPKRTPTATIVVACAMFGGLLAVTFGQRFLDGANESQQTTLLLVAAGAVIGGVLGLVFARMRPQT